VGYAGRYAHKGKVNMKYQIIIFTILFSLFLQGCDEERKPQPAAVAKVDENKNPRLSDPNPSAWKGLSMKVVISDFQESDGIFSSLICDEVRKRLSTEPLKSLQSLKEIDKNSRMRVFNNCLSPEADDSSAILNAVSAHSNEFPVLIGEIKNATKN